MKKQNFNEGWICYPKDKKTEEFPVTIPHDAMLRDSRDPQSAVGINGGWFVPDDYIYRKTFFVPEAWREKRIVFEFEGVYHKAGVFVNGKQAAYHVNGYTGFFVEADTFIKYGEDNEIVVEAGNSEQPNSRWYSGTGIYRPVWMYLFPQQHILPEGIRITTQEYQSPRISVEVRTRGIGKVQVEILEKERLLTCQNGESDGICRLDIALPDALLWEPESPRLYTCRVTFGEDIQETDFGIRIIECTAENGFCINGKRVILRGACIHHDNGILGACAYDFSEKRKIRILKENGFNAVRAAHNPCSKALLKACDELGVLLIDEYADMWYIHKTKYDYASEVEKNYREDLKAIVDKDYNHPSVIMYSTGNEVSETAQKRGIKLCGEMTQYLHELDKTRPVTCGINIFFNFLSSMGFGVYSDKKADKDAEISKNNKAVGSEFFNNLAGIFGSDFMKWGATLYPCDLKTKKAFERMDVAGYNYGIFRYRDDLKKYPKRLILGSETFCSDAWRFWDIAKKEKRVIGDFVWSGMDYLGEVGIGAWEYEEYAPKFDKGIGWITAGAGRIDLTGKPLAEMQYMKVVYGIEKIGIGVIPVNTTKQKHSPSAWKMTNAIESWSWNGCSGMEAKVEIYARADYVELYINGACAGRKKPKENCRTIFNTKYEDGTLRAVAYDKNGCIAAQTVLKTAETNTILTIEPEQQTVARESELCYVRFRFTDKNGTLKPLMRGEIKVKVDGGTLLGFGSACPYYPKSYMENTADTYYGEALAIIRPDESETITIKAESKYGNAQKEVRVV